MRASQCLIIAAAVLLAPAAAAQTVPLTEFSAIKLQGGGNVILRHGPVQRVTILSGSTQYTKFDVTRNGTREAGHATTGNGGYNLVIRACDDRCPRDYDLKIEIVSPDLAGIAVQGGGGVVAQGDFPAQPALGVSVQGGGSIDARAISATSVGASVNGGGEILTRPLSNLGASVRGGGEIRYWGNPVVGVSIDGGGSVTRALVSR